MSIPEWFKPGFFGAVVGAGALAISGFAWGGWMTGGAADKMASEHAQLAVVAALVPICVEQSNRDPRVAEVLAELQNTSNYQRRDFLMKTGWATMPGSSEPDRDVARACAGELEDQF